MAKVSELVGKDLAGFQVVEMTEVFRVNDDGVKSKSLGFFRENNVAVAFAGVQTDAAWHKTRKAFVLTDGVVGYDMTLQESVNLFDDEAEALRIKEKALAKLSSAERQVLGFK